jgi:hypothetical protein
MTGRDALDTVHTLASFVTNAYNIHLAVVTAMLGLITAAYGSDDFSLTAGIKVALCAFYLFLAASSFVAIGFLYSRINAMSRMARALLKSELGADGDFSREIEIVTEPVQGKIHLFLFPVMALLILLGIWFAPLDAVKA